MASHGIVRSSRLQTAEHRQQELEAIQNYRGLDDQVRQQVAIGLFDQDTFQLTSKLLRLNPEYYTAWNIRRKCLMARLSTNLYHEEHPTATLSSYSLTPESNSVPPGHGTTPSSEHLPNSLVPTFQMSGSQSRLLYSPNTQVFEQKCIQSELQFTVPLLVEFPKCYWIWNYRRWVLNHATALLTKIVARTLWEEELRLVEKLLNRDRRNFHAWGYRRHVVAQLESLALGGQSLAEFEFIYTTKMIRTDLSNFSAWHNRSQLIPRLLADRRANDCARQAFLDSEFDLVRAGLDVGPEDQSLWYYHKYLMLNVTENNTINSIAPHLSPVDRKAYVEGGVSFIRNLLEDYADVKWIYEALIESTCLLCRLSSRPFEDREMEDVAHWLFRLRVLDRQRSGCWDDLEKALGLAYQYSQHEQT